jgi:hypothetical protein
MSRSSSDSAESLWSVLTCVSEEYHDFYNNEMLQTDVLSDDVLRKVIRPNSARLRAADTRYRLDHLLSAMLEHAPDLSGKRYVAVCLHIAQEKGEAGVVNAAKAWMDNLLLPSPFNDPFFLRLLTPGGLVLAISKRVKTEPASSQTPTIDTTMPLIESASRNDQSVLRDQVSIMPLSSCLRLLNLF